MSFEAVAPRVSLGWLPFLCLGTACWCDVASFLSGGAGFLLATCVIHYWAPRFVVGAVVREFFWGQRRVLVFSIAVVAPHEHSTHKHPNLWGVERRRFKGCISRYSTGWGRESFLLYLLRFSCLSPTHLWKLFMSSWSGCALLCSRKFFWCRWWRGGFRDSWKILKFYVSILLCAGSFLWLLLRFSGNYSFLLPMLCVRWVCPGWRGSWRLLCGRFCLVRRRLGYVLGYGCVLCSGGRWVTH